MYAKTQFLLLALLFWAPASIQHLGAASLPVSAFRAQIVNLPATVDGDNFVLEAQVFSPPNADSRPLAVLNHGSPRKAASRQTMTTHQYYFQKMEFARRGYLTIVVMRRGYGRSEGKWFESYGRCASPD